MSDQDRLSDDDSDAYFHYLDDGEGKNRQQQIGAFTLYNTPEQEMQAILYRALNGMSTYCPTCDELCPDHAILLRDQFLRRLGELSAKIVDGVDLYQRNRAFGISEPEEVIQMLYAWAAEHSVVYALAEPQMRGVATESESTDADEA